MHDEEGGDDRLMVVVARLRGVSRCEGERVRVSGVRVRWEVRDRVVVCVCCIVWRAFLRVFWRVTNQLFGSVRGWPLADVEVSNRVAVGAARSLWCDLCTRLNKMLMYIIYNDI